MDQFSNHPLYRKHNIDSVMSSLWDFYKKKFVALFITSFIISLVIQYLTLTFDFRELQTITDPAQMLEKLKGFLWPVIIISIISLISTVILHYYVIFNPLDSSVTIFTSLYKSLKYIIPYLILMVLFVFFSAIAMALGIFVLIIGIFFAMIYVFTLYLFILPIMMVEGPSIANAISRAFSLAHKGFWSNIGWVAVFILLMLVVSLILSSVVLIPFTGSFLKVLSNPEEASKAMDYMSNPYYLVLMALVNALFLPMLPIFASILYFNGKAGEEEKSLLSSGSEEKSIRIEDLYSKSGEEKNSEK